MTKLSTQIYSYIPQYDVYEVSSKKNEGKVSVGGVNVDIFCGLGQKVGLNLGFLMVFE
jgi:hypothetical protein